MQLRSSLFCTDHTMNSRSDRPAAFRHRAACVSHSLWTCLTHSTSSFSERRARSRAPAPSVNERSIPARRATGDTESTRATGKVAAELRAVTRTSMPAEPLRLATSNHPFLTHAARTRRCGALLGERAVERSEERLVHFSEINSAFRPVLYHKQAS